MELYKEILTHVLSHEQVQVSFPNLKIDAQKIVETAAYMALRNIKEIIHDESLEDDECFKKLKPLLSSLKRLAVMEDFVMIIKTPVIRRAFLCVEIFPDLRYSYNTEYFHK